MKRSRKSKKWTVDDIEFKDPITNKFGSKTIFINLNNGTGYGGGRARYQFRRCRLPFDVRDTDFDGNPTDNRNLTLEAHPKDIEFIEVIEEALVTHLTKNSKALFGKKLARVVIEDKLQSLIGVSKGDYPRTVRTKANCDPSRPQQNTVVRVIEDREKMEYELGDLSAVTKNSEAVVIAEFTNVWFAGNAVGLKLAARDMMLWKALAPWENENPFEGFDIREKKEHDFDLPVNPTKKLKTAPTSSPAYIPPAGASPHYTCATKGCGGESHES